MPLEEPAIEGGRRRQDRPQLPQRERVHQDLPAAGLQRVAAQAGAVDEAVLHRPVRRQLDAQDVPALGQRLDARRRVHRRREARGLLGEFLDQRGRDRVRVDRRDLRRRDRVDAFAEPAVPAGLRVLRGVQRSPAGAAPVGDDHDGDKGQRAPQHITERNVRGDILDHE